MKKTQEVVSIKELADMANSLHHPYKSNGQLCLILDNDDHFHGAETIQVNGFTIEPCLNGIRISFNDGLTIKPVSNTAIRIVKA